MSVSVSMDVCNDLLLTYETISEARDMTRRREAEAG